MKYNFDKDTNRKSTNSFKWNCIPESSGRELYPMWVADMEKRAGGRTKIFLLCNPQNPTGTVWTKEELKRLCSFCQKHRLIILSDEIHYDLIFGAEHTMTARVSEALGIDTITLTAPGKTFNVAGIQSTSMIINNMDIRREVQRTMKSLAYPFEHAFAEAVTIGAYLESEEWLEEMLVYIGENRRIFQNFVKKYLPVLQMADSQATYLMWVDYSKMGLPPEELYAFWRNKCGVVFNEGGEFRGNAENFVLFNVACQRDRLVHVLECMKEVFEREGY